MDRWIELEQLGKLRNSGLLSDEEFEKQKSLLLREPFLEKIAGTKWEVRNDAQPFVAFSLAVSFLIIVALVVLTA